MKYELTLKVKFSSNQLGRKEKDIFELLKRDELDGLRLLTWLYTYKGVTPKTSIKRIV
jgi:hypothetical protein